MISAEWLKPFFLALKGYLTNTLWLKKAFKGKPIFL
jgi:hypothetical protein